MDLNFINTCINELDFNDCDFKINIRIKQRNNKKNWTIIENLECVKDLDIKLFNKDLKKTLCCNSSIQYTDDNNPIIQLQGDHREVIKNYLNEKLEIEKDNIIVHGY